jgi:hypothetical protein
MSKRASQNVQGLVRRESTLKKEKLDLRIHVGLETRCNRFNEKYPVGSVVVIELSQKMSLAVLVESPAKVIKRNQIGFIEFNHDSVHGAYLINLVKRKVD